MKNIEYAIPKYLTARDIKYIREKLKLSQNGFSKLLGCSKPTIERWESGKEEIKGPAVLLLTMLENNMDYVEDITIPKKEFPLRMYYMLDQKICTVIDIDDRNRKIKIKNFTNNMMFRAFGINEKPSYDDYIEFLKSRCFPETRDKLKLVLDDLGLPFYDPYLIVKKTEGRMAEDYFWLKIEE